MVALATGTFTVLYMEPPLQRRGTISRKVVRKSWSDATINEQRPRDKEQYSTHRCAATSTQGASVRNDARSALVASGTSMVAANKTSREQESRFIHFSGSITDADFLPRLKNIIDIKRVVRGAQFRHKTIYWILPLPDASSNSRYSSDDWVEFQMLLPDGCNSRGTLMFKEPSPHLYWEARRILRAAVENSAHHHRASECVREVSHHRAADGAADWRPRSWSSSRSESMDYTPSDAHKENAAGASGGSSWSLVNSEDDASTQTHEQDQSSDSFDASSDCSSSTSIADSVTGMVKVDLDRSSSPDATRKRKRSASPSFEPDFDAVIEIDDVPDRSPSPDATRKRERSASPSFQPESQNSAASGNANSAASGNARVEIDRTSGSAQEDVNSCLTKRGASLFRRLEEDAKLAKKTTIGWANHVKKGPRMDYRRRGLAEKHDDETRLFYEKLTNHHMNKHVFDYEPFAHDWLGECWRWNRYCMISIRNRIRNFNCTAYARLLSKLPQSVYELYEAHGFSAASSAYAKSWLLGKLLEAHRGEIVQLSRLASARDWQLIASPCPKPWNSQLFSSPYMECGRSDRPEIQFYADWYATRTGSHPEHHAGARYMPDWSNQQYLCVVPCRDAYDHHWLRSADCSTLGDMFAALGEEHSADAIYDFYLSRFQVARKVSHTARRPVALQY